MTDIVEQACPRCGCPAKAHALSCEPEAWEHDAEGWLRKVQTQCPKRCPLSFSEVLANLRSPHKVRA